MTGGQLYGRYCAELRRTDPLMQPPPLAWEFLPDERRRAWEALEKLTESVGWPWFPDRDPRYMTDDELEREIEAYYDGMDYGPPSEENAEQARRMKAERAWREVGAFEVSKLRGDDLGLWVVVAHPDQVADGEALLVPFLWGRRRVTKIDDLPPRTFTEERRDA